MGRKFNLIDITSDVELLPKRSTALAAGYDLKSNQDIVVPPIDDLKTVANGMDFKLTMVHTGVSVEMLADECLILANRSSNGVKRHITIPNGIGVIDADYQDEILVPFLNFSNQPYMIKKGDRIAQGIFTKYLTTDDDVLGQTRSGGFGSTGDN